MKSRSRGFTLVELLVALGIAALILGIAAPSFDDFRRNNRLTSAANDFLASTQVARTEAIKRQVTVSICPSTDPPDAAATCSGAPFNGWIAFLDLNGDCARAGAGEDLVQAGGLIATTVNARSNGTCISFAPTGFTAPATNATRTVFCDDRGLALLAGQNQSAGRGIFVTNTGRSRVTRDANSGATTDVSTWGLGCP